MSPTSKNRFSANSTAIMFLLALMAILMPDLAMATPSFFTVPSGDKSIYSFLAPIFGAGIFNGSSSSGSGPLIGIIGIFNAAALTIGGILAAYTLVAGTMQTAHDGEMLGKRWSSMWLPIRTILGVGLVVPIGGGYCVAQLLVGWLCMQGVGLADTLWSSFAGSTFNSTGGLAPTASPPKVNEMAQSLLVNLVCMEGKKAIAASGGNVASASTNDWTAQDYSNSFTNPDTGETTVSTGRQYGSAATPSACGTLDFATSAGADTSGLQYGGITMTDAERASVATAVQAASLSAAATLESTLDTFAQSIVNTPGGIHDPNILATAAANYTKTVGTAANTALSSASAVSTLRMSASSDGWLMAGAWFMRIAAMQDVVNSAASQTPSIQPPSSAVMAEDDMKFYFKSMNYVISNNPSTTGFDKASSAGASEDDSGFWHNFGKGSFKAAIRSMMSGITEHVFKLDPARHPIMAAKDFGDYIMGISEAGILGAGIAIGFLGIASTAAGGFLTMLTTATLIPLFAFGAGLSLYIPMIPFITFFGCAMAWVLLVCEAMIAAPLWAVMHLTPSGDDLMGGARQGYMILLGLLLRPALLIFGFCFCVVAIEPLLQFYNQIFFPVFFSSQANSLTGLFSMIIGVAIYFGTMTYFIHKIFGIIHLIPDQLLGWIGGGHGQLGQIGGGAADAAQRSHGQMLGAVAQVASGAAQQVSNYGNSKKNAELQGHASDRGMIGEARSEASRGASAVGGELGAAKAADAKFSEAIGTGRAADLSGSALSNAASAETLAAKAETWGEMADATESQAAARSSKYESKSDSYKRSGDGQLEGREIAKLQEEAANFRSNVGAVGEQQAASMANATESFKSLSAQAESALATAAESKLQPDIENAQRLANLVEHTAEKLSGNQLTGGAILQNAGYDAGKIAMMKEAASELTAAPAQTSSTIGKTGPSNDS